MPQPVHTQKAAPSGTTTMFLAAHKPCVVVWDGTEAVYIDPESAITALAIDPDHKNYIVETLRGTALGVERNWTDG